MDRPTRDTWLPMVFSVVFAAMMLAMVYAMVTYGL